MLEVRRPNSLDESPVAYLLLERDEHYERDADGTVTRAHITLHYKLVSPRNSSGRSVGAFDGGYDRCLGEEWVSLSNTRLTPGAVFLDLGGFEGHRIGTYLMNEIVCWAKQWPEAQVMPIELKEGQATPSNLARRNRFYTQFGLSFDFVGRGERAGMSQGVTTSKLNPVYTWQQNIRERAVDEVAGLALESARDALSQVAHLRRALVEASSPPPTRPIRWDKVIGIAAVVTGVLAFLFSL